MSCNSCENNCVQTLNVITVPMDVADTNTVDLTLAGSTLTADVKHQCEIDSDSNGIKLANSFYDGLVPAANIESTVNETNSGIYGPDNGFVTKNLVKKNGCKIEVYSPAEHTVKQAFETNSIAAVPTGALGTYQDNTPDAVIVNNTNRSMQITYGIHASLKLKNNTANSFSIGNVIVQVSVDGGPYNTVSLQNIVSGGTANPGFDTYMDTFYRIILGGTLAAGATRTLAVRLQYVKTAGNDPAQNASFAEDAYILGITI